LRMNCKAAARISPSVTGGAKLNSNLMLRHIRHPSTLQRPARNYMTIASTRGSRVRLAPLWMHPYRAPGTAIDPVTALNMPASDLPSVPVLAFSGLRSRHKRTANPPVSRRSCSEVPHCDWPSLPDIATARILPSTSRLPHELRVLDTRSPLFHTQATNLRSAT